MKILHFLPIYSLGKRLVSIRLITAQWKLNIHSDFPHCNSSKDHVVTNPAWIKHGCGWLQGSRGKQTGSEADPWPNTFFSYVFHSSHYICPQFLDHSVLWHKRYSNNLCCDFMNQNGGEWPDWNLFIFYSSSVFHYCFLIAWNSFLFSLCQLQIGFFHACDFAKKQNHYICTNCIL